MVFVVSLLLVCLGFGVVVVLFCVVCCFGV